MILLKRGALGGALKYFPMHRRKSELTCTEIVSRLLPPFHSTQLLSSVGPAAEEYKEILEEKAT